MIKSDCRLRHSKRLRAQRLKELQSDVVRIEADGGTDCRMVDDQGRIEMETSSPEDTGKRPGRYLYRLHEMKVEDNN